MFYIYDEQSEIVSKFAEEPDSDKVAFSNEDFDLSLYDVIIGHIHTTGEILKYYKKLKPAEVIEARILLIETRQIDTELDIDYRLSMIELGLI